jgi:enamine deaminase RidA (YjgF/YER057c/UK114 family)
MSVEQRISELGLVLPPTPKPAGVYRPVLISGNHAYVSGHAPLREDGTRIVGRVEVDLHVSNARAAARQAGLAILSSLRAHLGSLDRIHRVVKILGLVNCTADFQQHPAVINGCSELFVEVFGEENGVGARSAVGANSLPGNISVEIEAIFELRPQ